MSGSKFWPFAAIIAKLRQRWPQLRAKRKPLPVFPSGTKFFDVEGVPVALVPRSDGGLSVRAFDRSEPRPFPIGSVDRNGTSISEGTFLTMVGHARLMPRITPADAGGWASTLYDVAGDPVMIGTSPDGREIAWNYARFPELPEVSPKWVRAFGFEIDAARFDGLVLAKRIERAEPCVFVGADGGAVVVTPKATITRRPQGAEPPRWRRGFDIPVAEFRQMRHAVGELARQTIEDSQGPYAFHPFPHEERSRAIGQAMCDNLNANVMERHGGVWERDMPGFRSWGFSDTEIADSKRVAAEVLAQAAAR